MIHQTELNVTTTESPQRMFNTFYGRQRIRNSKSHNKRVNYVDTH